MKNTIKIVACLSFLIPSMAFADNRIVFYIRHAPLEILLAAEQEAKSISIAEQLKLLELQTPKPLGGAPAFSLRRYMTPSVGGIIALYAGYRAISNNDGLLSLPLRQVNTNKIYIAITPQIRLVNVMGNTYSHREFINDAENPVQLFCMERKQDAKQMFYWDTQAIPVPADKVINPITIVILAHPDNLYIKQEQSMATDNVQMILPNIYLLSPIDPMISLRFMDIAYLFETITTEQKKVGDNTTEQMIMNI